MYFIPKIYYRGIVPPNLHAHFRRPLALMRFAVFLRLAAFLILFDVSLALMASRRIRCRTICAADLSSTSCLRPFGRATGFLAC